MAITTTTNYGFPKPAYGDAGSAEATAFASDMDTADAAIKANLINLQAATPGTQQTGHISVSGTVIAGAFSGPVTGSATSLKSPASTGLMTVTGMGAGTTRAKTVRDADDTLLELGGSYTPSATWNWTSATVTWPTFNQSTTGTAAHGTTWGPYAGIAGPAQARTFTLPDAAATLLYDGKASGAFGTASSATGSVVLYNAGNANAFTIQPGATGAALSWTLPIAAPGGNNYLLNAQTTGVLGYTDPATFSPVAGSSSIATVGTVGTGTWQGTRVASAYGGNPEIVVGEFGYATLSAAITTIGATPTTVVVKDTQVADGLTFPATLVVKLLEGSNVTLSNGTVLTNNGVIEGPGTITFNGTSSLIVGANSITTRVNFTGASGKVTATSVNAPEISYCKFTSIGNGIEAASVTKGNFANNTFTTITYTAVALTSCNDCVITGVINTPNRGVYLVSSLRNTINVDCYNAGENSIFLYSGSNYNVVRGKAYNSNNYGYIIQTSNYNQLIGCVADTTIVDETFNLYDSNYNQLIGCIGRNSKLNNFELSGSSSDNTLIECESWDPQADYGFAIISEVDGGGSGALCDNNSLIGCRTNGGTLSDYFIGSTTKVGFCHNTNISGCYGYSTTRPNIRFRNDIGTIASGNYLYHASIANALSFAPDAAAGRRISGNIFPNITTAPTFADTVGGRVRVITSSAFGYAGSVEYDYHFAGDATSAGFNVILITAAQAGLGRTLVFTKTDSTNNAIGILRQGSDTINGGTSISLPIQWSTITIQSDGVSNWILLSPNPSGTLAVSGLVGAGLELPHVVKKVASANIWNSHDAVATSTSLTYAKAKTIKITNGLVGQQRFLFDIKTVLLGGATAYGKIYRNGVALGTEQTDVTGGYVTKSQDITQTWNPGDTCELWIYTSDAAQAVSVQNFRIAYDDSPTVAVASTNTTP